MAEEINESMVADMLDNVGANLEAIRRFAQERTQLTAVGVAANKRVTVVVNADGHVIETRLAPDYSELSRSELAAAITAAAQQAIGEIRRRTSELIAPIKQRHDQMPKISELIPGMPDLTELFGTPATSAVLSGDQEYSEADTQSTKVAEAQPHESMPRSRGPEIADRTW